jgi:competence protein ComEA
MKKLVRVLALLLLLSARCPVAHAEVELNAASQAALERVKGIGVAMSERLLTARAERPFTDWADLMRRVPGIGERTARRLSQQGVVVAGRPYAGDAPASAASAP